MRKNKQKWYIPVNENNFAELEAWWKQHTQYTDWPKLPYSSLLLSEHPNDDSYFWGGSEESLNTDHPSYQKITLEEFRIIINSLPEHWYIAVTDENIEELNSWRLSKRTVDAERWDSKFIPGASLLSSHPADDGSYFWLKDAKWTIEYKHPEYKLITLEQFRQITTNQTLTLMSTLPTKWYIEVTRDNQEELNRWRLKVATSHRSQTLKVGYTLLSKHHRDNSYYYSDDASEVRDILDYADYQEITLEQFRQITNTNPISKHPENWYIPLTAENYADIKPWWLEQVEKSGWKGRNLLDTHLVLSNHPKDDSHYWCDTECQFNKIHPSYEKITLEQFLQITNTKHMSTHPEKWYIEITRENKKELEDWRQKVATSNRCNTPKIGQVLLSKHHRDNSYYYADDITALRGRDEYKDYKEITLEQFRQITNSKPMSQSEVKTIQISRTLLNQYYEAATAEQREYIINHFKVDGTTTDESIRELHELACLTWKPKIKANHPDCFPEKSKYFDFSKYVDKHGCDGIVSSNVADLLGLCRNFIQVRGSSTKNNLRAFYLTSDYNWELIKEGGATVLIPTKNVK